MSNQRRLSLHPACLVDLDVLSMFAGMLEEARDRRAHYSIREAEVAEPGKVVLFADEIHMLVGTGPTMGSKTDEIQKVHVVEPSEDGTLAIFRRLKASYRSKTSTKRGE